MTARCRLGRGTPISASVALLLAMSAPGDAQDAGRYSARVEAVRVDVLVTNGGRPVLGLTAQDFEVLDNGVPQKVELVSFDQIPLNVVLAFDVSESVAGERLEHLQRAGNALLAGLTVDDQAALVTFSERVRLAAPLSKDRDAVRNALDLVSTTGTTSLADGIYAGITVGESDVGRALVIVFSDGVDTASWLTNGQLTDTVKRSDVVVYGAAVKSRVKPALLAEIASLSGGQLHEIEGTQNLEATFLKILNEFRTRYLVSYTAQGVSPTGWHTLAVRVKQRRANIVARPGYLSGK